MGGMPQRYERLKNDYPEVFDAYEKLGKAVHTIGSLDDKTRALIKLAISATSKSEGAVQLTALVASLPQDTKDEIRQTILIALPTIGLPSTMAALSWVDDILDN